MNFRERGVLFDCAGEALVGVLAEPELSSHVGVLIVVGGPQYRAGSHRQFLLLARRLAAAGFPVLRFDYRGMGDSTGGPRNFENIDDDLAAAMQVFQSECPHVRRVALWGLCDGASAALLYWKYSKDVRLAGLVLLNPWVRSEATLARTRIKHYYGNRLLQKDFWKKLVSGQFDLLQAASGIFATLGQLCTRRNRGERIQEGDFPEKMALAFHHFPGRILLVLSGRDYTAREFEECVVSTPAWQGALQRSGLRTEVVEDADHTFSRDAWARQVENLTLDWLFSLS